MVHPEITLRFEAKKETLKNPKHSPVMTHAQGLMLPYATLTQLIPLLTEMWDSH